MKTKEQRLREGFDLISLAFHLLSAMSKIGKIKLEPWEKKCCEIKDSIGNAFKKDPPDIEFITEKLKEMKSIIPKEYLDN